MEAAIKHLGKIGYDTESGMYWGEVIFLCNTVHLQAESVEELRSLIHESVRNRRGEVDGASGIFTEQFFESLVICLEPTLYHQLSQLAALVGKSLNEYISDTLQEVANKQLIPEPV